MKTNLTNQRTNVQFRQYGKVRSFVFNGSALRAMNVFRSVYGRQISFSILAQYKTDGFLPEGNYTEKSIF